MVFLGEDVIMLVSSSRWKSTYEIVVVFRSLSGRCSMLDCLFNNTVMAIAKKLIFCTLLRPVDRRIDFESHLLTFLLPLASSAGAGLFGRVCKFETSRYMLCCSRSQAARNTSATGLSLSQSTLIVCLKSNWAWPFEAVCESWHH